MNIPAVRAWMTARANAAIGIYRIAPLKRDDANYPFARHDTPSIRDKSSTHFVYIRNGVKIVSEAEGSQYIEYGNAPDGSGNAGVIITPKNRRNLWIPAKHFSRMGTVIIGNDGKPYFVTKQVKSYKAEHLLENSVKKAFGS